MAAAAHTKGGYGGVPQSVGKEFNQADKGKKLASLPPKAEMHRGNTEAHAVRGTSRPAKKSQSEAGHLKHMKAMGLIK
jgi:hypothetical protein